MSIRRRSVGGAVRRIAVAVFSETFTGANGSSFSSSWTNPRTTTGAVVSIQNNQGSVTSGTLTGYTGKGGIQTVAAFTDLNLLADYTIMSAGEYYPMIGFRSSSTWSSTHAAALDSYWFEIKRNENSFHLYKRVGDAPSLIATTTGYVFTTGDVIHVRLSAFGTALKVRVWKNAELEPVSWQNEITDTSHSQGKVYLAINGGADAVTDEARFDNVTITGVPLPPGAVSGSLNRTLAAVVPAAAGTGPPTPPVQGALTRIGATWTGVRPAASMDSTIAAHDTQAQHIIAFGAPDASDGGIDLNPSPGVYNWAALDPYVQDIMDAGATKPVIILCRCPPRMRSQPPPTFGTQAFYSWQDTPPLPAFRAQWASLCAAVAARYTQVKYFSYWNEMKGYWNLAQNRWDYETYTADYNAVWNAVKAVRPDAKIGGPYVILQSGASTYYPAIEPAWSHGPSSLTFPGGSHDTRQMAVMQYFVANAVGFDFLSCDGGIENQFPKDANGNVPLQYQIPVDPYQQIQKLWGWWSWVRTLGGAAATCELFNFETYVNQTGSTHGYTQAQKEDLFIELARQTQANVPNPTVSYLTWFHPLFVPQVVNKSSDFVWANTTSTFKAKVDAWHGTTATFSDPLTMFLARYPANGAEIWVDPAGNDANAGTTGSPKRTVQGAINAASAGSRIRVRAGNYNDGPFVWTGKNGTASNWIRMQCEPGVTFQVAGGGSGQGLSQIKTCSFIAIWGGDWVGVNNSANPYEVAHLAQFGAHSFAIWGGLYRNIGGAHIATLNSPGRFDICYNHMHTGSLWNENQTSAFSCLGMTDVGTAWPDGYQVHIMGNVMHNIWTEEHLVPPWGGSHPSDGNGVILDRNGAFTGKCLVAKNLIVGCGGRGIHVLETHKTDVWLNTSLDNSQNLAGSWIGELSITEANNCRMEWNVAAARPGNNRVGIFAFVDHPEYASSNFWGNNVFLRGTGGEDSVSPSVNANGNVNRTATGPANYFVQYQPGVFMAPSITNVAGYRPKLAQVQKFTPSAAMRTLLSSWPDPLGFLPPATGDWAVGAFEAA